MIWETRPLGEMTENFDSVRVPVRERDRRRGPYPYYGASGVVDYVDGFLFDGEYLLIAEDGENLRTRNTPIAMMARGRFWVNNHAHIVRANEEADTRFLYYALALTDVSPYLTGSTMPKLTQGNMNLIPLPSPPPDEQRAISTILGALDDKIEYNNKLKASLEDLVKTIFTSWFVDFDPIRDREGTKLADGLADLFPSSVADTEAGPTPKGWRIASLGSEIESERGLSYSGSGLDGSGVPLHNLNSIYEGGGYKHGGLKRYIGDYDERHLVQAGDLIMANTEQGHERHLIGYAAIVPSLFGDGGIYSHHVYRIRPKKSSYLTSNYLLQLFNSSRMHDVVSGFGNGTTVNMLPADALDFPRIVLPPKGLVEAFERTAALVQQRCEAVVAENAALAELRQILLPRLIHGDIRVKNADRLLRETA